MDKLKSSNIGYTVYENSTNKLKESLIRCLKRDIHTIQVVINKDDEFFNRKDKDLYELLQLFDVYIIHSPFWVSYLSEKAKLRSKEHIQYLINMWAPKKGPLHYVTHPGSIKSNDRKWMRVELCRQLAPIVESFENDLELYVENTSGSFSSISTNVEDVLWLKNNIRVKACIDTEHAYANGENIDEIDYTQVDLIHLNAIPQYVKFGNHLDRHSYTPLKRSKDGIKFIKKIKKQAYNKMIILERANFSLARDDIKFYENIKIGTENEV